MQDDKRRRKFEQIERETTISDKIIEWANNIDNRINDRKERRMKRRQTRHERRLKRKNQK
jgi:hypothetical protein